MSISTELYTTYCEFYKELSIDEELVFFESHNSIDFAGNMLYIAREISRDDNLKQMKIVISCTEESQGMIESFLEKYAITNSYLIKRESEEYFKVLAMAKYLFTDVAFYPLYRKKEGQVCVSTWHGTPLKTLGFTFFEDSYVVANQKRGFCLADYFICPNNYTWNCIKDSYQLDGLFKGEVIFSGSPRNSVFFNEHRRDEVREKFRVNNKKVIAYLPTWRGRVIEVDTKQSLQLYEMLEMLDDSLTDEFEIWVKLHRLNQEEIDFSEFSHIRKFPMGYETYDLLNATDALITDYSSVMFDFMLTGRQIILYCYDKEDYVENRKCYFDIEKLPFPIVEKTEELIQEIKSGKKYDDTGIINYFCQNDSADSVKKILKRIMYEKGCCKLGVLTKKEKKKRLLFVGDLNGNNATDALFEFLERNNKTKFYISYMNHLLKNKGYKLLQFKKENQIPLYMFQGKYSYYTLEENKVEKKIKELLKTKSEVPDSLWEIVDNRYRREFERYTYQNSFGTYIRFAGLDLESLKWFRIFSGEKIIYIHDNMVKKAYENYEYQLYLQRAIEVATEIHFANRAVFELAENLMGKLKGKIIVERLY